MLDKEICKNCLRTHVANGHGYIGGTWISGWKRHFESHWEDEEECICSATWLTEWSDPKLVNIHDKPPKDCHYLLEQILKDNTNAQ